MDLNSRGFKIEAIETALAALERRRDGYDDVGESLWIMSYNSI